MTKRIIGEVKWFSNERGYGFILDPNDDKVEYFVHYTSIVAEGYKTLKAGQKVSFELTETDKGIQAVSVKIEV
jgi:CspA family cold shock protein